MLFKRLAVTDKTEPNHHSKTNASLEDVLLQMPLGKFRPEDYTEWQRDTLEWLNNLPNRNDLFSELNRAYLTDYFNGVMKGQGIVSAPRVAFEWLIMVCIVRSAGIKITDLISSHFNVTVYKPFGLGHRPEPAHLPRSITPALTALSHFFKEGQDLFFAKPELDRVMNSLEK